MPLQGQIARSTAQAKAWPGYWERERGHLKTTKTWDKKEKKHGEEYWTGIRPEFCSWLSQWAGATHFTSPHAHLIPLLTGLSYSDKRLPCHTVNTVSSTSSHELGLSVPKADHISGKAGKRKIRHMALFQDNSSLRGGNECSVMSVCLISGSVQITCTVRKAQFSSLQLLEQNFSKLINTIYNSNRNMARKGKHKTVWDWVYTRIFINLLKANKLNPYGPLRRHFWFKPYIDLVCWERTYLS